MEVKGNAGIVCTLILFMSIIAGITYSSYLKSKETEKFIEQGYSQTVDSWGRRIWVKEDK